MLFLLFRDVRCSQDCGSLLPQVEIDEGEEVKSVTVSTTTNASGCPTVKVISTSLSSCVDTAPKTTVANGAPSAASLVQAAQASQTAAALTLQSLPAAFHNGTGGGDGSQSAAPIKIITVSPNGTTQNATIALGEYARDIFDRYNFVVHLVHSKFPDHRKLETVSFERPISRLLKEALGSKTLFVNQACNLPRIIIPCVGPSCKVLDAIYIVRLFVHDNISRYAQLLCGLIFKRQNSNLTASVCFAQEVPLGTAARS